MLFLEKDKMVFKYQLPDGADRFADPLKVYRKMRAMSDGQMATWLKMNADLHTDDKTRSQIHGDVYNIVMAAFDGVPFNTEDGSGWTESYTAKLALQFYLWMGELKKNGDPSLT